MEEKIILGKETKRGACKLERRGKRFLIVQRKYKDNAST